MQRWIFVMLAACACPSKQTVGPTGGSGSGGTSGPPVAATCDSASPHVQELYRAEGEQREPARVAEYVADNTRMAMNDCEKDPARAACLARATTVAQLEKECLVQLDDEGTEGRK
jgi:hypothetical protein